MTITPQDRQTLRELAARVAEIAQLPVQNETINCWKALNGLRPVRPMVTMDQLPWHELNVNDELTLRTTDRFCQGLETGLRRTLYRWNHLRHDTVVEPFVRIGKVLRNDGYGISMAEDTAVLDPNNDVRGHLYLDQLKDDDDLAKLRTPHVELDVAATARLESAAREIFGGILDVRMTGLQAWYRIWDQITIWHGVEATLYDLADRPDFCHRLLRRLTQIETELLNHYEANGYLDCPMAMVHCTGAYSDQLPAPGYDPQRPRTKDIWTAGMAQLFSTVSPDMHDEFEIQYAIPWYTRFGLGYYGCCEPLDTKIGIIRKLPNVRKISMSPWVNVENGAAAIGRDYVFSRKPSPAFLARDIWDLSPVERDLRDTLDACARHGCPVELILKDVSTVRYEPKRLTDWAALAMALARG